MGDLLIRNISKAVRSDIERLAENSGKSLSDTAREALRAGVEAMSKRQAEKAGTPPGQRFKEIFSSVFETDGEFEEFQQALDEVRRGPSRPVPDFE